MSDKARWTVRYDVLSDRMIYRRRLGPFPEKCSYKPIHDEDIPQDVVSFCAENDVNVCSWPSGNRQISRIETS